MGNVAAKAFPKKRIYLALDLWTGYKITTNSITHIYNNNTKNTRKRLITEIDF